MGVRVHTTRQQVAAGGIDDLVGGLIEATRRLVVTVSFST